MDLPYQKTICFMTLYIICYVSILLFLASTESSTIENVSNLVYGFKPLAPPPSQATSPPSNNLTITPTTPQQQQFQSTSPPSNNLTITPTTPQQQQLQPLQQLPQTTPPVTKPIFPQQKPVRGPPASFQAKGTINSVISVPTTKWIATGNWLMTVNYGNLTAFATNMSWFDEKGTATHTHEFLNFRPGPLNSVIVQRPDNNVVIRGLLDVGTNHKVVWKNVPALVNIKEGKTITISVNDKATNNHFASQPILGVVKSFQRCSDVPGPDMVILPPCS